MNKITKIEYLSIKPKLNITFERYDSSNGLFFFIYKSLFIHDAHLFSCTKTKQNKTICIETACDEAKRKKTKKKNA
jgi:hypothetical protein